MNRLQLAWSRLRASLWFVPTLLVLAASLLAVALVELDDVVGDEALASFPRLFGAGADGSRGVLTAIAGASITVAGVVFSITIVALSLTSSQYSSRVLRNFMGDRTNQVVLGTFVGIHAYCLIVLRTIRGGDEAPFVPSIATLTGIALAFVGIGVLIHFIHHITSAIQASQILDAIHEETRRAIARLYPDPLGEGTDDAADEGRAIAPDFAIAAPRTGYIENVAAQPLLDVACEHDAIVRIPHCVGEFVSEGAPLVGVTSPRPLDERAIGRLAGAVAIGNQRSIDQDAAFGIRQIVDIALKALSPAVNDPTTAKSCIDYLGALLGLLAERRFPSEQRYVDGRLRLVAAAPTFPALVGLAVDELVTTSRGNAGVQICLVNALARVARSIDSGPRRQVLLAPLARIVAAADALADAQERHALAAAIERATRLEPVPGPVGEPLPRPAVVRRFP